MKLAGVVFSMVRGFEARYFFKLTATLALFLFIQTSTSVSAQEDAAAVHDNHTGLAAAQLDHQHGPGTTHEHNVEHMLELLGVPAQVNKAADDVLKLYSAKVDSSNADPNIQKLVDAYQQAVTRIVYATLAWDNLKTTYIFSYAKRLDEDDVAQVTEFLQSPAGQKYLTTQNEAGAEIQQTTQHLMEADMKESLTKLGSQLHDGLARLRATKRETE